jgi:hypothetical protein
MHERRLARVAISFELLLDMMTEGYEVLGGVRVVKGVPKDAQFVFSQFDEDKLTAYLVFTHPDFAPIQPGQTIPDLPVNHWRYYSEEIKNGMKAEFDASIQG